MAAEIESKMSRTLRHVGEEQVTVTSLYGGVDWGPSDSQLSMERPAVIIATHEKAEALFRFLGTSFIDHIKLVVVDEAHGVDYEGDGEDLKSDVSRSLHLEMLVSRLLSRLEGSTCKFIALSAVAAGIEADIAHWMARDKGGDAVTTAYRSTRQLVGRLICRDNRSSEIRYDLLDGQLLAIKSSTDESPYIPAPFPSYPPAPDIELGGVEKKLRPYLFWSAMHMAARDRFGNYHSILISVPQSPGGYADDLLGLLDQTWKDKKLPEFFNKANHSIKYARCLNICEDYFGKDSREYRLLIHGIVLHHGKMPGIMSRLLIDLIQEHTINIVIATSTLTEGINLPFEVILIPTLRRSNSYLTSREIKNLIGRAGRPGISTEGRSLVLMDQSMTSGTANAYRRAIDEISKTTANEPSTLTDRGPLSQLLIYIYKKLKAANENLTNDEFVSWLETTVYAHDADLSESIIALDTLDGIILEAIQEADTTTPEALGALQVEDILQRLWRNTFSYHSTSHKVVLESILKIRGKSVVEKIYPSHQERTLLYKTSLPPRDGKALISRSGEIKAFLETGKNYYSWSPVVRTEYIAQLISFLSSIPSFAIDEKSKIGANWKQVLYWWLNPMDQSAKPSSKKVSAWYEYGSQNFVYRLNWGLGAVFGVLIQDGFIKNNPIDSWSASGLPWSVFWIKDMMTWGLNDPIATYYISNKYAETRTEALRLADGYCFGSA